jgi:hypothetical protein
MTRSCVLAFALFVTGTTGHLTAVTSQTRDAITRRDPREFKEVPVAVRNELTRRGCMIPEPCSSQADET